jgi:hypothetical protein
MSMKNLYPPIVPSLNPVFPIGLRPKIYFTLSAYNYIDQINSDIVQISVVNQKTNQNVVIAESNNNSNILITSIMEDSSGYYISLPVSKLKIEIDNYYKVQIRFLSASAQISTNIDEAVVEFQTNYNNYLDYLSEWSSVTLVRPISKPTLQLQGLDGDIPRVKTIVESSSLMVKGALDFEDENEEEYLKSYKLWLYEGDTKRVSLDSTLIAESKLLYPQGYEQNEIEYLFKYNLKQDYQYLLRIEYTTIGGYNGNKIYYLTSDVESTDTEVHIESIIYDDKPNGRIIIEYRTENNQPICTGDGCLVLKRASSEDNFTIWEDLQYFSYSKPIEIEKEMYIDYLVQDGIGYKYQFVLEDEEGRRGINKNIPTHNVDWNQIIGNNEKIIFTDVDFLSLIGDDTEHINIKLNPNVSNFQYTVVESKTDTLGSQYPFIRRNGDTYYRQFSLSGTISHFWNEEIIKEWLAPQIMINDSVISDEDNTPIIDTYARKKEDFIFKGHKNNFTNYYNDETLGKRVNAYNDFLLEQKYREWIMKFLYENKVRLYRSKTEGNILVKLMNITLSPKNELGRMIYDFSATAYEVDEYTYENCVKHHIHKLNTENRMRKISNSHQIGQIIVNCAAQPQNNMGYITKRQGEYDLRKMVEEHWTDKDKKYAFSAEYFTWIRIQFYSNPYPIYKLRPKENVDKDLAPIRYIISEPTDDEKKKYNYDIYYGYLLEIDNIPVIVSPTLHYYELGGDNTKINNLKVFSPFKDVPSGHFMHFKVDFETKIIKKNMGLIGYRYWYYFIGQLNCYNFTNRSGNIVDAIKNNINEYASGYRKTGQKSQIAPVKLKYLSFEGQPYTKIKIKDESDAVIETHMLNHTGILVLNCDNTSIKNVEIEKNTDAKKQKQNLSDDLTFYNEFVHPGISDGTSDHDERKDSLIDYVMLVEGRLS